MSITVKCPICASPYTAYSHTVTDQSACPSCVGAGQRGFRSTTTTNTSLSTPPTKTEPAPRASINTKSVDASTQSLVKEDFGARARQLEALIRLGLSVDKFNPADIAAWQHVAKAVLGKEKPSK